MINPIVSECFLLKSDLARELYHDYAADLPIIDYHNHLPVKDIAENRSFENMTRLWLEGDHYKWRAMRANGIAEPFITGNKTDWDKFKKWAETVPYTWRNPLFHWTHLELNKIFGIQDILNPQSAKSIFESTSSQLQSGTLNVMDILNKFHVSLLYTTDNPVDSLEWHQKIKKSNSTVKVIPTWRPDNAMDLRSAKKFNQYLNQLEAASGLGVLTMYDYITALKNRHSYFHDKGCRLSDHGLEFPFPIEPYTETVIKSIFNEIRSGKEIATERQKIFMSFMLYEMATWNNEKGWVQQFHIGALRDVNSRGVINVGKACGFDSIGDFSYAQSMGQFFNRLEMEQKLTKTIVYNLNPRDNEMIAAMMGNFQDGSVAGKMQFGAAWWFLDQKDGIQNHLNTLSNQGFLSRFVGMLTDSRSFLSFSRHEYFRRILCNLLAQDVVDNELPKDMIVLRQIVEDVCYNNAKNYFKF